MGSAAFQLEQSFISRFPFAFSLQVSYNAAGVLAHIASDGADAWTIARPTRYSVLVRMVEAIERWDLSAERNINYRSFEPILGLIRCYHTPQCQHWAVWALANLTKVSSPGRVGQPSFG